MLFIDYCKAKVKKLPLPEYINKPRDSTSLPIKTIIGFPLTTCPCKLTLITEPKSIVMLNAGKLSLAGNNWHGVVPPAVPTFVMPIGLIPRTDNMDSSTHVFDAPVSISAVPDLAGGIGLFWELEEYLPQPQVRDQLPPMLMGCVFVLLGQYSDDYVSASLIHSDNPTAKAGNLTISSSLVTCLIKNGTFPYSLRAASYASQSVVKEPSNLSSLTTTNWFS